MHERVLDMHQTIMHGILLKRMRDIAAAPSVASSTGAVHASAALTLDMRTRRKVKG